jgi:hypothetical protein
MGCIGRRKKNPSNIASRRTIYFGTHMEMSIHIQGPSKDGWMGSDRLYTVRIKEFINAIFRMSLLRVSRPFEHIVRICVGSRSGNMHIKILMIIQHHSCPFFSNRSKHHQTIQASISTMVHTVFPLPPYPYLQ